MIYVWLRLELRSLALLRVCAVAPLIFINGLSGLEHMVKVRRRGACTPFQ
jgi:hypothetical protein